MTLYDIQVLPLAATPAEPASAGLRLEDLERMALTGNPTLAQVQANVRMMAANARQAGLYPNPTVGYYGDEIRGGYSGGGKQGGFISQTIVTGGKLRAARLVGELLTGDEAETQAEAQRLRILNNARSQFYHELAAQRLVDVRQKLARLSADATRTSHQLANIGQADRPDILQAEVEEQQVRVSFRTAQRSLQSAWRGLAAVAGQADFPQTRLAEDLEAVPDLNYEEWRATTLRDSPEVKLAAQGVERADALLLQAKRAVVPDFRLYGNLSQNNQPLMDTSPRIAGVKWRCPDRRAAACFQSQPGQYCRREGRY